MSDRAFVMKTNWLSQPSSPTICAYTGPGTVWAALLLGVNSLPPPSLIISFSVWFVFSCRKFCFLQLCVGLDSLDCCSAIYLISAYCFLSFLQRPSSWVFNFLYHSYSGILRIFYLKIFLLASAFSHFFCFVLKLLTDALKLLSWLPAMTFMSFTSQWTLSRWAKLNLQNEGSRTLEE